MSDLPDRRAVERALLDHLDAAYNLARWLVGDHADAQDVVQESFMRAFRYFATLRGQDPLPWLLQIVRNTAYTLLDRRRTTARQPLPEDLALADESLPDPAAEMLAKLDAEMLRRAVDDLPQDFREVIVLRELQGLSYKQIADITGTSIGTVMSRISRARRRLQAAVLAPGEVDRGL